ncbi:YfhO family protein [Thiocapsa bogorovii]|uniref:YfhO family protein n=1 Tax=Thiocapsa bogorovii TaxID=521689 RepID=UPI001E5D9E83|nr:YfhO family protein [Thiocapsa bogorovii]UHD18073.1 YfhO family protein [Thiocapsa bogorovii]
MIAYGLLPVLFWLLLLLESKPGIGRAVLLGLLSAFWAANANQVVFLGGLLLAGAVVVTITRSVNRWRLIAMYGVAAIVSLILLAPVYSAILEVVGVSTRNDFTPADSAHASFSPIVFTSVFFPALFGNLDGTIWSVTDITQDFLYIGMIPVSLYLIAIFLGVRWWSPVVLAWLALTVFFVLFSLGVNGSLYPFVFDHIPGFDFFRRPADAAYMLNLLFASGLLVVGREAARTSALPSAEKAWQFALNRQYLPIAFALSIPLLAFVLGAAAQARDALPVLMENYGWLVVRLGLLAILLRWMAKQLANPNRSFLVLFVAGLFFAVDLGAAGRYSGLFSQRYSKVALARAYQHTQPPEADSLDAWLQSETAPWARVEIIGGGESMGHSSTARWYNTQGYNPIQLRRYAERIGAFVTFDEPRRFVDGSEGPLDPRFDVLGLRYVAIMSKWARAVERDPSPASEQARRYRDELANAGARKRFADDRYEVWERPGTSRWLSVSDSAAIEALESAPCDVVEIGNTRLVIECRSPVQTTLVIGEIYAPGWTACINGTPIPVEPFADLFRAVTLPAGSSTLRMTYHPVPFLRHSGC